MEIINIYIGVCTTKKKFENSKRRTTALVDTRSYHELNFTDRKCFVRERGKYRRRKTSLGKLDDRFVFCHNVERRRRGIFLFPSPVHSFC